MKHTALKYGVLPGLIGLMLWAALPARAELPKRNLMVELRQIEDGASAGYGVSTQARDPLLAIQQVQVRNGEEASLRVGQSIPMQWVQSASAYSEKQAGSGASTTGSGGSVTQAVTWMDAGQSFKVKARWPGARQPVALEVQLQSAHVGDRVGVELPDQFRSQVMTTVSVPLGQWTTIAAEGSRPQQGVYGTDTHSAPRRLLQIRVVAP